MAAAHPIALCPLHGLFPATAIDLGTPGSYTFDHCETNCPVCGSASEIIPGTYQPELDRINLLIDPSISLVALGAIRKLAERAKAGEISDREAKREAEKIHAKAAKLFDIYNWSDQAKATLYASIIGAIAVIAAARIASSPSQTTVINPIVMESVITNPAKTPRTLNRGKAPRPKRHQQKQ